MRRLFALSLILVAGTGLRQSLGDEPLPMPDLGDVPVELTEPDLPMDVDTPDLPPETATEPVEEFAPMEEETWTDDQGAGILVVDPEQVDGDYPNCMIDDFNFDYPKWYARSDAFFLERTGQGELITATIRAPDGTLGNNRINSDGFNTVTGLRAAFGRNIWDGMTFIEVGYFGLHDWINRNELANVNPTLGLLETNVDLGFGINNVTPESQTIDYGSTLHNAEINLRSYFSPNVAFIGGLRYFNLSERFVIAERGAGLLPEPVNGTLLPGTYFATRTQSVENSVLAPQLGFDIFNKITDDIRLGGMIRLGVGGNFTQYKGRQVRDGVINVVGIPVSDARVQVDEEWALTGIIELGLNAEVVLTRNIVVRGGYNFMYVHGLAFATEQRVNAITDPNGPQAQIENGANGIFFGPSVGLEISWGHIDY